MRAVIVCEPSRSVTPERVAVPVPSRGAVPSEVAPSKKLIIPVVIGMPPTADLKGWIAPENGEPD